MDNASLKCKILVPGINSESLEGARVFKTLLVEDDHSFREIFKETLKIGFPSIVIEEAWDGNEVMQKVDHFRPDLIFMDIDLPNESGLQLTKKIKAKYPDITIIILTSYDSPKYREEATQYGAGCYLVKGSRSKKEIFALVKSCLPHSAVSERE